MHTRPASAGESRVRCEDGHRDGPAEKAAGGMSERRIAVAIHAVEPATYERCALIRDWLDDHGVDRVTLLVIPAPAPAPVAPSPGGPDQHALDCRDRGDAIAQHGLQHRPGRVLRGSTPATPRRASPPAAGCSRSPASSRAGFVAPAYAYTPGPATGADRRLRLVGDADAPHRPRARAPLLPRSRCAGPRSRCARARGAAGGLLRLDVHPCDLDRPRHVLALGVRAPRRAERRRGRHLRRPRERAVGAGVATAA